MTRLERILIPALLIAILIGTALTYLHVTAQSAKVEGRIEYLTESERIVNEWSEGSEVDDRYIKRWDRLSKMTRDELLQLPGNEGMEGE